MKKAFNEIYKLVIPKFLFSLKSYILDIKIYQKILKTNFLKQIIPIHQFLSLFYFSKNTKYKYKYNILAIKPNIISENFNSLIKLSENKNVISSLDQLQPKEN